MKTSSEAERDDHGKEYASVSAQLIKSFKICQDQLIVQPRGNNPSWRRLSADQLEEDIGRKESGSPNQANPSPGFSTSIELHYVRKPCVHNDFVQT